MSSRVEQKAAAREARLQAEAAEATRATRMRRLRLLGGVAALAIVAVVVAIIVGGGSSTSTTAPKKTKSDVAALFGGIPEKGFTLGAATAPLTVEEFIDPQCPYCMHFSREALPTVLNNYVRTGKAKLVLRPEAFIGPDSVTAARMVVAASRQNKAWPFIDAFYANQGQENSGYVTDAFLRRIGAATPGLDVTKAMKVARTDPSVTTVLQQVDQRAKALGANSTPTIMVSKGKGAPTEIQLDPNDYAGSVSRGLDAALGQ